METKSVLLGIGGTIVFFVTIGAAMAAIAGAGETVTVPQGYTMFYFMADNAQAVELRDALCANYKYNSDVEERTCAEFAQDKIKDYLKSNVKKYRNDQLEAQKDLGADPSIQ